MLECMQSLGKRGLEAAKLDYEYEFYDKYLSNYANIDINEGLFKVNGPDQKSFSELYNIYSNSCCVPSQQRSIEQKLADSFSFYVAAGVINLINSDYYINMEKLGSFTKKYSALNGIEDISYSIGAK